MKGERSEGCADPKAEKRSESWNAARIERMSCYGVETPTIISLESSSRVWEEKSSIGVL